MQGHCVARGLRHHASKVLLDEREQLMIDRRLRSFCSGVNSTACLVAGGPWKPSAAPAAPAAGAGCSIAAGCLRFGLYLRWVSTACC